MRYKLKPLQKAALLGLLLGMMFGLLGLWYLLNVIRPALNHAQSPYAQ